MADAVQQTGAAAQSAVGNLQGWPASAAQRPDSAAATADSGTLPTLNLPKGGGAIRGIGEKFSVNPVTGTGTMAVP